MAKIVKNISGASKTWGGVSLANLASYTCNSQEEASRFAMDDNFIGDLSSGLAEVYSDASRISGVAAAITFLLDTIRDTDGALLVRPRAFSNSDGFRFRGASFIGEVAGNSTGDIDYKITAERFINGGRLIINNLGVEDKMTFQVVDKDNVMGFGAGVVLDEFIKDYYIPDNATLEIKLDYPARIYAGLYLRLKYTSTHESGCKIKCNLFLHWKAA